MWKRRLKEAWNERPLECIAVAAMTVTGLAALTNAASAAQGRRAYAKQVSYRVRTGQ